MRGLDDENHHLVGLTTRDYHETMRIDPISHAGFDRKQDPVFNVRHRREVVGLSATV